MKGCHSLTTVSRSGRDAERFAHWPSATTHVGCLFAENSIRLHSAGEFTGRYLRDECPVAVDFLVILMSRPKVLVSGCYDLLHAGHVAFFEAAAEYGDLYVCIGSDRNIEALKHHPPMFSQQERRAIVGSIRHVTEARISAGIGLLDFAPDLAEIRPQVFVVNQDGDDPSKAQLLRGARCSLCRPVADPQAGTPGAEFN